MPAPSKALLHPGHLLYNSLCACEHCWLVAARRQACFVTGTVSPAQELVGTEGTPSKPRLQQGLEWMHLEDDDSLANVIDALNFHNPSSVPKVGCNTWEHTWVQGLGSPASLVLPRRHPASAPFLAHLGGRSRACPWLTTAVVCHPAAAPAATEALLCETVAHISVARATMQDMTGLSPSPLFEHVSMGLMDAIARPAAHPAPSSARVRPTPKVKTSSGSPSGFWVWGNFAFEVRGRK